MGRISQIFIAFIAVVIGLILYYKEIGDHGTGIYVPAPLPIFIITNVLALAFRSAADFLTPAPIKALDDVSAFAKAQVLVVASRLMISEHLSTGPKTIEELATLCKTTKVSNMLRLMRTAKSFGYFEEDLSTKTWRNNRFSEVFRPGHPRSIQNLVRFLAAYHSIETWLHLLEAIRDDSDVFSIAHEGHRLWDWPEEETIFQEAMTNNDAFSLAAITYDHSWSQYQHRFIDIGSGYGGQLAHILETYPHFLNSSHGGAILFDQPQVIEQTKVIWQREHASLLNKESQVQFIGGSFFDSDSLPKVEDGDVLFMRFILHDWTDEDSIRILSNLRKAIGDKKDVTLALAEIVLVENDIIPLRYVTDLLMFVTFRSKERYEHEFQAIAAASGFKIEKISPMRTLQSLIQLKPI